MKRISCFTISILFVCKMVAGQTNTSSNYDPHLLFSPTFYPTGGTVNRSADGSPNTGYWQNRVNYKLTASLNDTTNTITGSVIIDYKNNSPHQLDYLWLLLDQNLFNKESRGQARMPVGSRSRYGDAGNNFDGGFKLTSVKLLSDNSNANYIVTDTRMQIRLAKALKPGGDAVKIKIDYSFILPEYGADRCGILSTKNGNIYAVAQWYPRMCVYDDVQGWNTNPYLGPSEFYCEYGDFDCSITAPANHVVVSGGILENEKEVLSTEEAARMTTAKTSDNTVMIRTAAEVKNLPVTTAGKKTWKFKLSNARDFAWASSRAFIWDAAQIRLPAGKKSLAQSVYPLESEGVKKWSRATEYTKGSIENYSKRWYPYPYPVATNVATNIGGMEYPGIVFCGSNATEASLFGVTDHEFGHTWFPMIVGSNERKYGWMDEGFNTFINTLATDDFNNGEYKNKENRDALSRYIFNEGAEGIFLTPDAMKEANIGNALYVKPGLGLTLLRDVVLGPERFDYAFKTYINTWAYKHPTPWDFFRTMDNAAGEELSWFWRGWFLENYTLDQGITGVQYVNGKSERGAVVNLINMEKMAMPVIIQYETVSGKKGTKNLPVEIWNNTANFKVLLPTTENLKSVTLDEEMLLPDLNRANNKWVVVN